MGFRLGWIHGLIGAAAIGIACDRATSAPSQQPVTADVVRSADLIIVGRVTGLADPSPSAQSRRQFELHSIEVERTLKGENRAGETVGVRPNHGGWQDGRSYVMLLRGASGNVLEPASQAVLEATAEQIASIERLIGATGGTVGERRVVWVERRPGNSTASTLDFWVTAGGRFEWRPSTPDSKPNETLSGTLPPNEVASLIAGIREIPVNPPSDDASVVMLGWIEEGTVRRAKACEVPLAALCAETLERIETLARRYARSSS
jgi:hypothetical protein